MSDELKAQQEWRTASGTPAERARQLRNERPEVERLAAHPYIERAEDVSFNGDRELLEVSFDGMMPEPFTAMDEISVLACWIGLEPGWWGTLLGDERARKYGLGKQCITALVEVSQ